MRVLKLVNPETALGEVLALLLLLNKYNGCANNVPRDAISQIGDAPDIKNPLCGICSPRPTKEKRRCCCCWEWSWLGVVLVEVGELVLLAGGTMAGMSR